MTSSLEILERARLRPGDPTGSIPLGAIMDPMPSRLPPGEPVAIGRLRETADQCRILNSSDVEHFWYVQREQWASYATIESGFGRASGTSHIAALPREIVDAPIKLAIDDRTSDIKCAVTAERIYPKRAWVGALLPGYDLEMAYAISGILNSAVGLVLYRTTAQELGVARKDLSKKVLTSIPIPLPSRNPSAFSRVALLAYRLQVLFDARSVWDGGFDVTVSNHWLRLLSEVVDLYGWPEAQTQALLDFARAIETKQCRRDLPTDQGQLFFTLRSPFLTVPDLSDADKSDYERLKSLRRRSQIGAAEAQRLHALERRIQVVDRLSLGIPRALTPRDWPGASTERQALRAAYQYLSTTRGQRFRAEHPILISPTTWELDVYYVLPTQTSALGRMPGGRSAGKLWVDSATGQVTERIIETRDAVAS